MEDLLAERGITVSYESIRSWVGKFGTQIAHAVRAAQRQPSDKWHLDEVVIKISGKKHWFWRAIDGNGDVLDILWYKRVGMRAALRKLRLEVDHQAHKGLNNRIEGSHRSTRKREKIQGRFKSARQAQRFLEVHDETANLFRPHRHKMTA